MRPINADRLKEAIVEEGQRSKRYKIGEFWELNREEIWKVIDEMPTVQPEIIRCKDCRFNTYSKKCLNPDSFFLVPADDFYCGYAERITDGA